MSVSGANHQRAQPAAFHYIFPGETPVMWETVAESTKNKGLEVTEPPFFGLIRSNITRRGPAGAVYEVNSRFKTVIPLRFPNRPEGTLGISCGIVLPSRNGPRVATTAIILAARGAWQAVIFHPKAPPLISAYGDLAEFWGEAAKSLKLEPEEAYLQQWNIGYDPNGEILYQTFKIYVDKGSGTHDVYYYSQDKHSTGSGWSASWSRQHLDGPAAEGLVPAHLAFAAINQIGFRELERHQNLQPPLRFWFLAESGSKTYRPIAGGNVVQGSQITPIAPDGVTMQGEHGTFGIAEGAVATTGNSVTTATHENPGPPVFIVPLSTN